MKRYHWPIWLVSLVLFVSCSTDEIPVRKGDCQDSDKESFELRSIEHALLIADRFFEEISSKTRSSGRNVEEVKIIFDESTRGSVASFPLFYLVNYANNQGFALLGASDNSEDIYAISPEGHFEIEDTVDNPGLKNFYTSAEKRAKGVIESTRGVIVTGWSHYYVKDKVDPMLLPYVSKWHQGSPFNKKCTSSAGVKGCAVGCGPLSVAMVLSYYEYPCLPYTYVDGNFSCNFNWFNAINDCIESDPIEASDDLQTYLYVLGRSSLLDAKYDLNNTTCDSDNFMRTFEALGYRNSSVFHETPLKDNWTALTNFLKNGSGDVDAAPVIMYGDVEGAHPHFWVVDGYIIRRPPSQYCTPLTKDQLLLHCVWGQKDNSGFTNGYFSYDLPDKINKNEQGGSTGNTGVENSYEYSNILVFGGYKRISPY